MAIEIIKYINYAPQVSINMKVVDSDSVIMEQELNLESSELSLNELNNFYNEISNKIKENLSNIDINLLDEQIMSELSLIFSMFSLKRNISTTIERLNNV